MSKYGVPRVNVTFKDINKIEEGYRIYKDTTSFDETTLPTPLVDISAEDVANFKKYNYFDVDVLEGNTYFYRVGAYGGGEEVLSDEKQVVADKSIEGFVYLTGNFLTKIDLHGNVIWSIAAEPWYSYRSIDSDVDGNVYVIYSSNTYEVFEIKKFDSDGNEQWVFDNGSPDKNMYRIYLDDEKNSYIGTREHSVKKINSNGSLIWVFDGHNDNVTSVVVDHNKYIYSTSYDLTVKKIDPNGNGVWSYNGHSSLIECVDVDYDGYVYSGSRDNTIIKLDPDGNEVWVLQSPVSGLNVEYYSLYVDYYGHIYAGGSRGIIIKIDADGNVLWYKNTGIGTIYDISIDLDGNIYLASNSVIKLSPDGSEVVELSDDYSRGVSVVFGKYFNKHQQTF